MVDYPRWTTSLDAIVAEIEARGLGWTVTTSVPNKFGVRQYEAWVGPTEDHEWHVWESDTGPGALCRALLAYLKEPKL
jgi:hypothetical protein